MKRERGRYYVGDRIMDRAWKREGTVVGVPEVWSSLGKLQIEWDAGHTSETWVPAVMLTLKFVEKLVKKMSKDYWVPAKGDRVLIPSVGIEGTVDYVDTQSLFVMHYYAIQVILDTPHSPDSDQRLLRTNLRDIKQLDGKKSKKDKKKKKPAPPPPPVEEDDFIFDDDEDDMVWDDEETEWD